MSEDPVALSSVLYHKDKDVVRMDGRRQQLHLLIGYNASVKWLSERRESTLGSSDIDLLIFDLQVY